MSALVIQDPHHPARLELSASNKERWITKVDLQFCFDRGGTKLCKTVLQTAPNSSPSPPSQQLPPPALHIPVHTLLTPISLRLPLFTSFVVAIPSLDNMKVILNDKYKSTSVELKSTTNATTQQRCLVAHFDDHDFLTKKFVASLEVPLATKVDDVQAQLLAELRRGERIAAAANQSQLTEVCNALHKRLLLAGAVNNAKDGGNAERIAEEVLRVVLFLEIRCGGPEAVVLVKKPSVAEGRDADDDVITMEDFELHFACQKIVRFIGSDVAGNSAAPLLGALTLPKPPPKALCAAADAIAILQDSVIAETLVGVVSELPFGSAVIAVARGVYALFVKYRELDEIARTLAQELAQQLQLLSAALQRNALDWGDTAIRSFIEGYENDLYEAYRLLTAFRRASVAGRLATFDAAKFTALLTSMDRRMAQLAQAKIILLPPQQQQQQETAEGTAASPVVTSYDSSKMIEAVTKSIEDAMAAQVAGAVNEAADRVIDVIGRHFTDDGGRIPGPQITLGSRITSDDDGGNHAVFRGTFTNAGTTVDVALKEMSGNMEALTAEVALLRRLNHPNIVRCYGTWRCEDPSQKLAGKQFAVLELMDTVLEDVIDNWRLDSHLRQSVMFGVVKALMYLHAQHPQVFHGDIKPLNVMLASKSHIPKLIDFDSSSQRHTYALKHAATGTELTVAYAAPELLSGKGLRSPATDIYALGVLLFQLWRANAAESKLFQGLSTSMIVTLVQGGMRASGKPHHDADVLTAAPYEIPPIIAALICACWDEDPDSRPTAMQVHELQQLRGGAHESGGGLLQTAPSTYPRWLQGRATNGLEHGDPQSSLLDVNIALLNSNALVNLLRRRNVAPCVLRLIEASHYGGPEFADPGFIVDLFTEADMNKYNVRPLHLKAFQRIRDDILLQSRQPSSPLLASSATERSLHSASSLPTLDATQTRPSNHSDTEWLQRALVLRYRCYPSVWAGNGVLKEDGQSLNRVDCLVRQLQLDPLLSAAWIALGSALQHRWGSETVTLSIEADGFDDVSTTPALNNDQDEDRNGAAGNHNKVVQSKYDSRACLLRALKIALLDSEGSSPSTDDASNFVPAEQEWIALGEHLLICSQNTMDGSAEQQPCIVSGSVCDAERCFREALHPSRPSAAALTGIGLSLLSKVTRAAPAEGGEADEANASRLLSNAADAFLQVLDLHKTDRTACGRCLIGLGYIGVERSRKATAANSKAVPNSSSSAAWSVTYNGKQLTTAQQCFAAGLALYKEYSDGWHALGNTLRGKESIAVDWAPFTAQKCFERALLLDLTNAKAWHNLGVELQAATSSAVGGSSFSVLGDKTYSATDCFVEALRYAPRSSATWTQLGLALPSKGLAAVNDDDAAEIDDGSVEVGGVRYRTKQQCFLEALKQSDYCDANAWTNLGVTIRGGGTKATQQKALTVVVQKEHYDAQQCFLQALRLNPSHGAAWRNLGHSLKQQHATGGNSSGILPTAQVKGKTVRPVDCFVESVRLQPKLAAAWCDLGEAIGNAIRMGGEATVCIDEEKPIVTHIDCFVEALRLDQNFEPAWSSLASVLPASDATVLVGGEERTKVECFVKALRLRPTNAYHWNNLGTALRSLSDSAAGERSVSIGEVQYNALRCYVEALRLRPKYSTAWYNAGILLTEKGGGALVEVDGKNYRAESCLVMSLTFDPDCAVAWNAMGNLLREGDAATSTVQIGKVPHPYTAPLCFAEALRCAPSAVFIWINLGDTLLWLENNNNRMPTAASKSRQQQEPPHVTVNGRIYTAQLCYAEAVTLKDDSAEGWMKLGTTVGANKSNWAGLVRWITGTPAVNVRGEEVTALECFLRAVHRDPNLSLAWYNLGTALTQKGAPKEIVAKDGMKMNAEQCLARSGLAK